MNRRSIATITVDGDGNATWTPSEKILALGFKPTPLGKPRHAEAFALGCDPNELYVYAADDPVKLRVLELNSSARAQYRTDRVARRMAKKLADARSPDR
jgi:hypothetical protein